MKVESVRLTKLVQEIVDLSRLQVADTLHDPVLVDVGARGVRRGGAEPPASPRRARSSWPSR